MSADVTDTERELYARIKVLSERLWEGRCRTPDIAWWLENFDGSISGDADVERLHALHLLSSVSYFGLRELRVLLKAMYRDLFRYPIIQSLRSSAGGTTDVTAIHAGFDAELRRTRFLGMGNPSESGTHLLYYFRQENALPKDLFVQEHELFTSAASDPDARLAVPDLARVVLIDDLCGSGQQSIDYSTTLLRDLREVAARSGTTVQAQYLVLFGSTDGLGRARSESAFDVVHAVSEIDSTYKTFEESSRVFRKSPAGVDKTISEMVAVGYGKRLWEDFPLGFDDGQLLIAFHHNVPDNSLPIIWYDEPGDPWQPAFARYPKVESYGP